VRRHPPQRVQDVNGSGVEFIVIGGVAASSMP
jgi:hypothetical protein